MVRCKHRGYWLIPWFPSRLRVWHAFRTLSISAYTLWSGSVFSGDGSVLHICPEWCVQLLVDAAWSFLRDAEQPHSSAIFTFERSSENLDAVMASAIRATLVQSSQYNFVLGNFNEKNRIRHELIKMPITEFTFMTESKDLHFLYPKPWSLRYFKLVRSIKSFKVSKIQKPRANKGDSTNVSTPGT